MVKYAFLSDNTVYDITIYDSNLYMSVRVALMSANSKACIKTVPPLITIYDINLYVRITIYCSKSYINAIHESTINDSTVHEVTSKNNSINH